MSHNDVAVVIAELRGLRKDVQDLEEQVRQTNGRVRAIELWKARLEGAKWAAGWIPPVVTASVSALIGAAAVHLFG